MRDITLGEFTTKLQTLAHDGHALDGVRIKIMDTFYHVGEILKMTEGNDENDKHYIVIDTEVK